RPPSAARMSSTSGALTGRCSGQHCGSSSGSTRRRMPRTAGFRLAIAGSVWSATDAGSTASAATRKGASAAAGEREMRTMSNSSTTTESDLIEPIHPGEILMEDFIEGFGITQNKLAVSIGVPPRRINEIVHGKRGITADTAIRLARYFGTSEEFWMNLQSNYELRIERRVNQDSVAAITPLEVA